MTTERIAPANARVRNQAMECFKIVAAIFAVSYTHLLGGGLGGAAGEGRNGGVDNVHAGFHGLQVGHEGKTGGGVGMQVDGQLGSGVLDGGNQIVSFLGTHDTGHILDADGGGAHFLQLLHHFHVLLLGVDGRGGVGPVSYTHLDVYKRQP